MNNYQNQLSLRIDQSETPLGQLLSENCKELNNEQNGMEEKCTVEARIAHQKQTAPQVSAQQQE